MSKANMYVFFTKTGKESKAVDEIKEFYIEKEVVPVNFSTELLFRRQGKVSKEIKPVFPGYLFTMSQMNDEEFIMSTWEVVSRSKNIIKLLRYGDSGLAAVKKEERDLFDSLLQGKEYIEASCGYIQGDRIIITEGPFVGRESMVKSINRHKMQATLELRILGEIRRVTVGLEIIAKYGNK